MGIYDMAMDGLRIADAGRERKKQKTLALLLSQAYQNPDQRESALGEAMAIDPQQAMAARQQFSGMDDDRRKQIVQHAQIFASMPDEMKVQAYPQLAAEVRKITGIPVPDQYDPKFLPMIQQMAGGKEAEQFTLAPGSARYDASGRQIVSQPFAPVNSQLANVPTGDGGSQQMLFNPRSAEFSQPNYGGGTPRNPQEVQAAIQQLAGRFGGQISSMVRTPEHNREVGGVPNSQHIRGTAGDVVIGDPAMRRSYMEAAKGMGFSVIDEGDHLHTQLPRGAQIAQQGPLGYTPPKSETQQPSAMMEKLQLAQQMGATPDQLRNMVIGDTGGGKPSATMLKQANTAKLKLIDLNAIEHQLSLVENAFQPLENSFSATPYVGKYLPTEDGKRFDAAVSLLQGMVRKLTRTPGEGAMSDYETQLAQLANPSRSEYESVTKDQLAQLKALVKATRDGYQAVLEDNGGSSANIQPRETNTQDSSIDALLDKYK
ncbi:D-Ala-D-Ala carboxypeptidase family metallohydrolase [Noviluteimonas gilva]|uniref:Peptidase M15A C-terminal domain-containing protein n=1 Tax=Noviluteimonas gilva TaxID=2682097 RepID=A0A7C9HLB3_9GAMM|nr:D-Ala-D-Ala carboxypeptidase family metallohydrolase [Lysobacter gilvus]MUV13595.1 hypothetical protein [Lysobacter gilvus]